MDWQEYRDRLAPLRARLVAEFASRATQDAPQLLAAFATDRGRFELWQAPDAATPQLHLIDASGQNLILDFAEEAGDDTEFLLGDLTISPDGRLLGYTVDPTGADRHQLRVVDLTEQIDLAGSAAGRTVADDLGAAVCWHDGQLVCTELDQAMTPTTAVRLSPDGTGRQQLCRAEPGEYLDLSQAADGRTVLISAERHTGNRLLLLTPDAGYPEPVWRYEAGGRLRFDTAAGLDWLLWSPPDGPDQLFRRTSGDWQSAAIAPAGTHWDELTAFEDGALLVERYAGGQRLRLTCPVGQPIEIRFDSTDDSADDPATLQVLPGSRVASDEITVLRESWRAPAARYRIPADGGPACPAEEVSPIRMAIHRLTAPSADGTEVPITLLGPPDLLPPWPVVLYGYGAYGVPVDPYYTPFRASLLDRGVGFAVAHLRGGGELGRSWHEAGRQQHKRRTSEDYLACARHLVAAGWCPPGGLVARCRSAGGVAVGAAINADPELFTAAVLEVPFVDCLRTLSDPAAALTELEWAEWGDPVHDPAARADIAGWSPVDNVAPGRYPALLITAGLADARVPPDGPRRYAEAVRACSTSAAPVFLLEQDSGHLGYSDLEQDWRGEADLLAFVLDQLGRTDRLSPA